MDEDGELTEDEDSLLVLIDEELELEEELDSSD